MFRLLLLLIVAAGVGAYFTKPDQAAHEAAARAAIEEAGRSSMAGFDLSGLANAAAASLSAGTFEDLYVVTKYSVKVGETPFLTCWGAFQQVRCSTEAAAAENAAGALLPKSE